MLPKISIIVPIYNVEQYIEACLKSILSQTFTNFELILVNDGSNDNSGDICDKYEKKDSRIKVIHKENGGVSSARNCGIYAANGTYIGFIDPDDTVECEMYRILVESAIKHDADIVICPIKVVNLRENMTTISKIWKDVNCVINRNTIENYIIPSILLNKDYGIVSSVNKLYKRSLFDNVKFDEKKHHGEDARLNFTLLTMVRNLVYVEKPMYNYLIHKRNSLTQLFREDLYSYVKDNKIFMLNLSQRYNLEKYSDNIRSHFTSVTLSYMQEVVSSNLSKENKLIILSLILNDMEFHEDLPKYKSPSKYYSLLKVVCSLKNIRILYIFIKSKIQLQDCMSHRLIKLRRT